MGQGSSLERTACRPHDAARPEYAFPYSRVEHVAYVRPYGRFQPRLCGASQKEITGWGCFSRVPFHPVPRYGAKLVGEVVYDAMNSHGCELFVDLPLATGVGHSTVVLIDRGDCFFVEKAWHAQLAGANAVIVADNVDEELLTMANPGSEDGEQAALTSKINIPSALVTKSVGDKIKQAIRDGAKPLVALDWSDSIASPDDHVEWELWSTSNQVCGQMCDRVGAFVNEMHDAAMKLEKEGDASFSPHFITWSCMDSSRPDCKDLCIFGGRYCAPDPTEGTGVDAAIAAKVRGFGYNGSAVTIENLRQLCLFRELNGPHHTAPWLWWTYAVRHRVRLRAFFTELRVFLQRRVAMSQDESDILISRMGTRRVLCCGDDLIFCGICHAGRRI